MCCNKTFLHKRTLNDHIVKRRPAFTASTHPDYVASVSSKIHECTQCTYKTAIFKDIREHLISKHPEIADNHIFNHVLRNHPEFIASVTLKIHKCTMCTFKTTISSNLRIHLLKHPETAADYLKTCSYCNASFKRKSRLDEHLIRRHPNCVLSVTTKIHECTQCTYKTTNKSCFRRHLVKHSEMAVNHNHVIKTHPNCAASVSSKVHECSQHPDFMASVSSKIHECTMCSYKTTITTNLNKHNLTKHPEALSSNSHKSDEELGASYQPKK
nr:unnamed protein product [Callosobruchus analis]